MTLVDEVQQTEVVLDPFVMLAFVHEALDNLDRADLGTLDDDWLAHLVHACDRVVTRTVAASASVAAEVERRGHALSSGFFTSKAYLKHHGLLSGPEALMRMKIVRLFDLLPDWSASAHRGDVGVDQIRLMAQIASNPRLHEALVDGGGAELLFDAEWVPYDLFEQRARSWARLADPDAAAATARRRHDQRDVRMRQRPDGSWRLSGSFGSLQGAEMNEVLAHFSQAEFESDWAEARELLGVESPVVSDLARVEPQRRADALHQALLAGAESGVAGTSIITLNVLFDERTLDDTLAGRPLDPASFRDMVCRTQNGNVIDVTEAARLALASDVRRAVINQQRVVIDLGRRSRVFRGTNRDAALLLFESCVWPGCDQRVRQCQADHAVAWLQHGDTDPANAACLCGRHNRLKHRGRFTAYRDPSGAWAMLDADNERVG